MDIVYAIHWFQGPCVLNVIVYVLLENIEESRLNPSYSNQSSANDKREGTMRTNTTLVGSGYTTCIIIPLVKKIQPKRVEATSQVDMGLVKLNVVVKERFLKVIRSLHSRRYT